MNKHVSFWLGLIFCLCLTTQGFAGPEFEKTLRLPVLTVSGTEPQGQCLHIDLTVARKAAKSPLTVAIAEDTPGGVGESARASVWLAAMVTALDRGDDLSGVRIALDIPGDVDGPSAGAMICLGIMSALDGREVPAECVMTGMIMPDGSIGEVGGMVQKLQAAAAAKAQRVLVPANVRFAKDLKTGADVDLKRLAADLKLELVPVENIGQAYALAHKLALPAVKRPAPDVLALPLATEEWLKRKYKADLEAGTLAWEAIPQAQRDEIAAEPVSRDLLVRIRANAENAFRSGRLLYAQQNMAQWRAALAARASNEKVVSGLKGDTLEKKLAELDARRGQILKGLPDPWKQLMASGGELNAAGTQFCGGYFDINGFQGLNLAFQAHGDELAGALRTLNAQQQEQRLGIEAQLVTVRGWQLLMAHMIEIVTEESAGDNKALTATLPSVALGKESPATERLFYSASLAAHNALLRDVVKTAAQELQVSEEQAFDRMCQLDLAMAMYQWSAFGAQALHRTLGEVKEDKPRRFGQAAAAHVHAANLAQASGLIMRWELLEVSFDEQSGMRYGRTDLLNHLLNAARETALVSIATCRERNLPCVQAIASFEQAEMERDDKDQDKVEVLMAYWTASLQAKALMMLAVPAPAVSPRQ